MYVSLEPGALNVTGITIGVYNNPRGDMIEG